MEDQRYRKVKQFEMKDVFKLKIPYYSKDFPYNGKPPDPVKFWGIVGQIMKDVDEELELERKYNENKQFKF